MSEKKALYQVFVDDNFHYMDDEYRYRLGSFDDAAAAIAACKRIVDEFLKDNYKPGMSAEDLWQGYRSFGEDPFITSESGDNPDYSSWRYAKERCQEMCRSGRAGPSGADSRS